MGLIGPMRHIGPIGLMGLIGRMRLIGLMGQIGPMRAMGCRDEFVASSRWSDCFIAMKQLLVHDEANKTSWSYRQLDAFLLATRRELNDNSTRSCWQLVVSLMTTRHVLADNSSWSC